VSCRGPVHIAPSNHAKTSRGRSRLSRLRSEALVLAALVGLVAASPGAAPAVEVLDGLRVEVVVTEIPRPIQLALDAQGRLVVLGQGWRGDAAGELFRIDPGGPVPASAARMPRVVIPFASEPRKMALGSLAVDPRSGDLFLGEENGNRIYRFGFDHRLQAVAVGLNHLLGGSAMALDGQGRLVFIDYASPESHRRSETPQVPSLAWLTDEGYRGPEVFRLDLREARPLPQPVDLLLPRGGSSPVGREPPWRLIGVTAAGDDPFVLSALGELFRLSPDGVLRSIVRLPAGHYHRINMAMGPDGSVYVCGGFQIRQIYRISAAGEVTTVASELSDPGGIVVDRDGALYVAETALHRIIRIVPAAGRR
jgi:hypothetical protein